MKLFDEFKAPIMPILATPPLQDSKQKKDFEFVKSNLITIHMQTKSLISAIALFQYCTQIGHRDELANDWQFIAARDGAMSLRNFAHAIANVRGAIGKIPTWLDLVDVGLLKSAHGEFESYFPFAHKLRHSVAHPELYDDPNKAMGVEGGVNVSGMEIGRGGNVTINQGLFNNRFACTFEGELIEYELSRNTCSKIIEICKNTFVSFHPVSDRIW